MHSLTGPFTLLGFGLLLFVSHEIFIKPLLREIRELRKVIEYQLPKLTEQVERLRDEAHSDAARTNRLIEPITAGFIEQQTFITLNRIAHDKDVT